MCESVNIIITYKGSVIIIIRRCIWICIDEKILLLYRCFFILCKSITRFHVNTYRKNHPYMLNINIEHSTLKFIHTTKRTKINWIKIIYTKKVSRFLTTTKIIWMYDIRRDIGFFSMYQQFHLMYIFSNYFAFDTMQWMMVFKFIVQVDWKQWDCIWCNFFCMQFRGLVYAKDIVDVSEYFS